MQTEKNGTALLTDTLLGKLYDAVLAPDGFSDFIYELVCSLRLKAAIMVTFHVQTKQTKGLWMHGLNPSWMESYSLNYGRYDMLAEHIAASPISRFYASNLDLDSDIFETTDFYQHWIVPQGVAFASGAILLREGDWDTQLILQRSPAHGAFHPDEIEQFNRLLPHLRRAVQMRQRFVDLHIGGAYLVGGFDSLAMPTIVVDEFGCVAHHNHSAALFFNKNTDLQIEHKALAVQSRPTQAKLDLAISKAVLTSHGELDQPASIVQVHRAGRKPIMILVTPMRSKQESKVVGGALLFAFDPESAPRHDSKLLQKMFSLSEAEAALATGLCSGLTLDEVASSRFTSLHTVRSQLKSIFLKTGTQRQSELVAVLLSSPAYFVSDVSDTGES